ncbi:erythromycin esterase family protein [Microlunatus speluncae]|uniref:erythromycin esterase family protein n=1 Tax=Microlunatus speluncae TaxID=2594267 RepID=UPI0012664E58|nr:erythromycin esterase family protein [Microlunatus speluncae]
MTASRTMIISRRGMLASAAGIAAAATAGTTLARADERTVEQWIATKSDALKTVRPTAPLDDLRVLQRSLAGATLVGLGEPGHNLAEVTTLKHRVLRLLVERLGFRTLIWEEDWSIGLLVDEYVRTGVGDLAALIAEFSPAWRNQEVIDTITWVRHYNARHRHDQVHFVGAEHYATRAFVYERLSRYVAEVAPDQHPEVETLITALLPNPTMTIGDYAKWYFRPETNKEPYLRNSARLRAIVDGIRRPPGDRRHSVARQMARQIEAFYLHYSKPWPEIPSYRDLGSARTIRWWQEHSRSRSVYWAATAHTSRAAEVRYSAPEGPMAFTPAGSHLAEWFGDRYRVVALAFDHGTYRTEQGALIELPRPLPQWYESTFAGLDHDQSALDLRQRAPGAVRDWLAAPFQARGFPDLGADSTATGGTLADWFDVIIRRREVTPADPYP